MESWVVVLIVVLVAGVGVIMYGAVSDRRKHHRRVAELRSPPQRSIPQFAPNTPAPRYLTELEAHRPPPDRPSTELTDAQRAELASEFKDPRTTTVTLRRASADFISDRASGWSVLDEPRVLCCADKIRSIRELLGVLEKMILSKQPLVIIAPAFADEVLKTLEANQLQGKLTLLALTTDDPQAAADAMKVALVSTSDLQAGYLPDESLGTCRRWVAEARRSHVIMSGSDPVG